MISGGLHLDLSPYTGISQRWDIEITRRNEHAVSPLLDFIFVTCDLSSGWRSAPSIEAGVKHSPTSYLFPPFLRRTMDTFVNL